MKPGMDPVVIQGQKIATTFWGQSWCKNLESYSDYSNRLPRGRSYARNGSVLDLKIGKGMVNATISGSRIYEATIKIDPLSKKRWDALKAECCGHIPSLLDLLKGKLSGTLLELITQKESGMFPSPREIHMDCSCPDWASLCKHLAAVLYGVGARLDRSPELFFLLRGVDHAELIGEASMDSFSTNLPQHEDLLVADDLGEVFGIDFSEPDEILKLPISKKKRATPKKKTAAKKRSTKKIV